MLLRVLGPWQLEADTSALWPRDRVVLSALAVRLGEAISVDSLSAALWGDAPPASRAKVVQGCVSRLRHVLGASAIETGGGYRLRGDAVQVDRDRFESLVARGHELLRSRSPERAVAQFTEALGLWRGRPFDLLDEWVPGRIEAARLEELRLSVQEDLLQARLDAGDHRQAATAGVVLAGEQPWRERRWALLALAQYRCGRQADALASIRTARRVLGEQLGLDPGSDLVDLERRILSQDPALAAVHDAHLASSTCPWKGLASYDAEDRDGFFGRAADVSLCLSRLAEVSLLVLAGPSGCGKSSLMNAGLGPALRHEGREVVTFSPGTDGPAAMALARATAATDPVLLIDQFEEALAGETNPEVVGRWLREIADYARGRALVVISVRADHLAGLTVEPEFARLAEQGLYLVAALTGDALRQAIEEPARRAGLRLEPGLTDLLVRDAEDQPGALPLLSHALTETWLRREEGLLTVEGYRASGGIRGAVASSADRLFESLAPDERVVLRSLLLRMVSLSDTGEPIRTPLPAGAVADPERRRLIDLLVRSRLVTSGETSVELAHEAMVRAWPRLRAWLDEDTAGQRIRRHLTVAVSGWEGLDRAPDELYQGARLDAALEWAARDGEALTESERAFLDASVARADDQRYTLARQAQRQRTQNRRLRVLLAGSAALLLVAVGSGLVALDRGLAAQREGDASRSARDDAQHESLVARSLTLRATNRSAAALLAVEAFRRRPDALAQSALLGTITASPGFLGYRYLPGGASLNAAVITQTQRAVVSGKQSHLGVLNITTGRIRHPFGPPVEGALDYSVLRVSSDGNRVAQLLSAPADPSRCGSLESLRADNGRGCSVLVVHDIASGRRVLGPVNIPFAAGDVAINQDGTLVAVTGGLNGDLATYSIDSGRLLGVLPGLPRPAGVTLWRENGAVVFDLGNHVYLGSMRGPVREVAARTLRQIRTLDAPRLSSNHRLFITGDDVLIGAGNEGQVALDLRTGKRRWTVDLRTDSSSEPCPYFTVAEAVGRTYCGNDFGQLEERDLETGERTGVELDAQLGSVGDLVFTERANELIAFAASEGAYSRWRLDGSGLAARLIGPGGASPVGYDPSGRFLVGTEIEELPTLGPGITSGTVILDRSIGDAIADVPAADGITWVGAGILAYWGPSGAGLLDVLTGETRAFPVAPGNATDQVFPEPSGHDAWASEPQEDGTTLLRRFGLEVERSPAPEIRVPGIVQSVAFSPDGRTVLVTYLQGDWQTARYDILSGHLIDSGMPGQARIAVSSTGQVVGGDPAGEITAFKLETLSPVASLPGSRAGPSSLQFDSAGAHLLVTSGDQTVQVYDAKSQARLGDPLPAASREGMVEGWLRPDGQAVTVNGPDGIVEWTIDPVALARAACVMAGRNLTRTEWSTYLGDTEPYRPTCADYPAGA